MSDCCRLFDSCLLLTAELLALNAYWQPDSCGACLSPGGSDFRTLKRRRNTTGYGRSVNSGPCKSRETPPNAGQCGLSGWLGHVSLSDRCLRRHVTGLVMGAAQSWQRFKLRESPIKHGVELTGGFQFHLPPVFRPPASASLNLPPSEGHEANGAADDTPPPRNTA